MTKPTKISTPEVLLLIAPCFDEKLALQFLASLRETGMACALVSLAPGMIQSLHGVRVRADFALGRLPETLAPRWIFILEDPTGAATLLADGRVQQLLARTLSTQGKVVVLQETQALFHTAGFSDVEVLPKFVRLEPFMVREFVRQRVSVGSRS